MYNCVYKFDPNTQFILAPLFFIETILKNEVT